MTVISEKWDSPRQVEGDNPSVERRYLITDAPSDADARFALKLATGYLDYTLPIVLERQQIDVEPEEGTTNLWNGVVKYGRRARKETNESEWSFDTSGGSAKITQSLSTVGSYGAPGVTPPNYHGAIGVQKDSIEGCEITVPQFAFSETHYLPAATVTWNYAATLRAITGKTNFYPWRAFEAGEVLFLGASGRRRGQDDWEVAYKFVAGENVTGLQIGSITGIAKRAWDYLWVRYEETTDGTALVRRPIACYVERVYREANFGLLGIH